MIRFGFQGGDGDQSWFGEDFVAERVEEPWFPSVIERGPAYLLKVITGKHRGRYLAITSRFIAPLDDQVENQKFLSVVVHVLRDAGPQFEAIPENLSAIGMAVVEVVRPSGSGLFANPWAQPRP